jgi:hypothetical protein
MAPAGSPGGATTTGQSTNADAVINLMTECSATGFDLAAKRMDIQVLLGHSTIDTTPMDTYVRQKRMAAVISRL